MSDCTMHMHVSETRVVERCPACADEAVAWRSARASVFDTMVAGKVLRHPEYCVQECAQCGLFYKSHTLSRSALDVLYAGLNHAPFDAKTLYPTDRIALAALAHLPSNGRVLDFGCSTGRLLSCLPASLAKLGVEVSESAAAVARSRGVTLIDEAALFSGAHGRFDAILCTDVFEHLIEPMTFLQPLVAALAPGGLFVLVTGNASMLPKDFGFAEAWYFRLASHLQMLSERHVGWLAQRLALQVLGMKRCCHYDVPAPERLRQRARFYAYRQFKLRPASIASKFMRRLPLVANAERWDTAPAVRCTRDHVVLTLRKSL